MAGEDRQTEPISVGHWNADDQERMVSYVLGVSRYESEPRKCGAPKVLLCFAHCWHAVERLQMRLIVCCSFRKEESCSMRVHIDRKRLDGDAIAFVVIMLLIAIAFAY